MKKGVIEDPEVIRKILEHLGLRLAKRRPQPKANSPPPAHIHLDYSDSQIPPSEDCLYKQPEYPVDAYISNFKREGSHASFTQFGSRRHNPIPHQAISLYPLEAPVFLPMTAYHSTAICCGIHPLDTQAPSPLYSTHQKASSSYHSLRPILDASLQEDQRADHYRPVWQERDEYAS